MLFKEAVITLRVAKMAKERMATATITSTKVNPCSLGVVR